MYTHLEAGEKSVYGKNVPSVPFDVVLVRPRSALVRDNHLWETLQQCIPARSGTL